MCSTVLSSKEQYLYSVGGTRGILHFGRPSGLPDMVVYIRALRWIVMFLLKVHYSAVRSSSVRS